MRRAQGHQQQRNKPDSKTPSQACRVAYLDMKPLSRPWHTCRVTSAAVCSPDKRNCALTQANSQHILVMVSCKARYAASHVQGMRGYPKDVVVDHQAALHAIAQLLCWLC